jgi:hypothetical protein
MWPVIEVEKDFAQYYCSSYLLKFKKKNIEIIFIINFLNLFLILIP